MSQVKTINAPFEELRRASAANGGTALSSTATLIALPEEADWVSCIAHNFVGALVAKLSFNPYLTIIRTLDLLVSEGVNLSSELQDGDTTDVAMDAFDTFANGDAIYVGSWMPFSGCKVTVGSDPQNSLSVLTVDYWNGSAWTAITETDGTETGGNTTFAQTGDVTWTVPAAWQVASLQAIDNIAATIGADAAQFKSFLSKRPYIAPLYWTRWTVSAATEATWNLVGIQPLNRSTSLYSEWPEGFGPEMSITVGPDGFSCIEALVNAGSASLVVNVASRPDTTTRRMA